MNTPSLKKCASHTDNLVLVNGANPFCGDITPDRLAPVGLETDGVLMERHAAALLNKLMDDIHGWGQIAAVSGWRSGKEQQTIWEDSLHANGEAFTRQFVASPGCSEHQTGLAIDLGLRQETMDFICPDFPYTGICQTFRKHAARYGFIQRYPSGKEHITGIAHEPWHFRYVGIPHAEIMTRRGITLEEYLELLRQYPAGQKAFFFRTDMYAFSVSYLPAQCQYVHLPEAEASCLVSRDNCGGLIMTTWKNREY